MSTNVRRNLVATISPQVGEPLTLSIAQAQKVDTTSTGIIATLIGAGGAGGYSYSITGGSLPTNTTLNTDGTIEVTGALAVGLYTFVAEVQDSASTTFAHSFSIQVYSRLYINPRDPYCTPAEFGAAYSYQVRIGGYTGTVSYSVSSGSLPAGLSMSSGGLITGTPSTDSPPYAASDFVVTASDSGSGETIDISCTILVYAGTDFPTGNFVPDGYSANGYNGGLGDIPAIVQGQTWSAKWAFSHYAPGALKPVADPTKTLATFSFQEVTNGIDGSLLTTLTAAQTTALSTGAQSLRIAVFDDFGVAFTSLTLFVQVVAPVRGQQVAVQPKQNGVDVGSSGPLSIDFVGSGIASVTSSGGIMTVTINAGAGGVTTVNAFSGAITLAATSPISVASGAGTVTYSHANSGVTAGEYTQFTVNATGHVTSAQQMFGTVESHSLSSGVRWFAASLTQSLTRVIRWTGAAGGTSFLSGLPAPSGAWSMYLVVNGSTTTLTVENEQALETTAANRFAIGANFNLAPGQGATFWYDSTTARWRCVGRQS